MIYEGSLMFTFKDTIFEIIIIENHLHQMILYVKIDFKNKIKFNNDVSLTQLY